MNLVETLAPLYGKTAHGQTKVWFARYYATADGSRARYEIEHGQDGGKLQLTVREITEGKNIGRKNETTPLEQCKNEIIKKWTDKQKKEGYTVAGAAAAAAAADASAPPEVADADAALGDIPRPMLAQQYKRDKNSIVFPCFVQPKLDGLRCLIYRTPSGKIATQSRTGGFFEHLQHITESIAPFFENPAHHSVILDGELYTTEIPFETLAGLIKKKKVGAADLSKLRLVQYHIYDFIDRKNKKITFAERAHVLGGEFAPQYTSSSVVFVDTTEISNGAEMTAKFQEFVSAGYEGIMLRNRNGVYRENVRSVDLQKYKEFEEEEYTIVGYTQGEGRDAGTVIWICETEEGRRFNVRPRGTLAARRELFQNAADFVGKKLTVIFQELSEQKVPRFPVGKDVRIGY